MKDRLRETAATYDAVASRYLEQTRARGLEFRWLRKFAEGVPKDAPVLDLGSGPGRDAQDLRRLGLDPICLDLSIGMLRAGISEYPGRRVQADLRSIPIRDAAVLGVWANASLLHLTCEEFRTGLNEISRVLSRGGRLHLSLKQGIGSEWESARYGKPRWFQYWSDTDLDHELTRAHFRIERSANERGTRQPWLVRQCVAHA